jgi:hypothetical protein
MTKWKLFIMLYWLGTQKQWLRLVSSLFTVYTTFFVWTLHYPNTQYISTLLYWVIFRCTRLYNHNEPTGDSQYYVEYGSPYTVKLHWFLLHMFHGILFYRVIEKFLHSGTTCPIFASWTTVFTNIRFCCTTGFLSFSTAALSSHIATLWCFFVFV